MEKVGKESNMKKIKSRQKARKPKEKKAKQMIFTPRLRLEPRLSSPSSEKNKKEQKTITNIEKDKKLIVSLDANEIEEHLKCNNLRENSNLNSAVTLQNANERSEASDARSTSPLKNKNQRASLKNIENCFGDVEDFQKFIKQSRQRCTSKGMFWTDREKRDLAYGLQYHGFGDTAKLAAEVKTKTENEIKLYIKYRIMEKRKAKTQKLESDRHRGRPKNPWANVSQESLKTWPAVRKWRRLAYEQMLSYTRDKDYSRPVILALCNKFYEEEPEPSDPQIINVKLIYKYIHDCMAGTIPPQLPPKESALVLDLLREVRLMPIAYDFEEERQFLKDFKSATTFKPFQVKDEFKKKFKKDPEEMDDSNAVPVPEEVFLELSRHKRLVQSFNPLMTPVWMVQKEQEHLEKYLEESTVYVD